MTIAYSSQPERWKWRAAKRQVRDLPGNSTVVKWDRIERSFTVQLQKESWSDEDLEAVKGTGFEIGEIDSEVRFNTIHVQLRVSKAVDRVVADSEQEGR